MRSGLRSRSSYSLLTIGDCRWSLSLASSGHLNFTMWVALADLVRVKPSVAYNAAASAVSVKSCTEANDVAAVSYR